MHNNGQYGPPPPHPQYQQPPQYPHQQSPQYQQGLQPAPFGLEPATGIPYSDKTRTTAGLLQLLPMFIGVCGVGRMYSGHVGIGIAQFFLGWLTCGIWPMIDAFMMFSGSVKAGDGRPLRP